MKIGIQTWGSDGDIHPFIALAGGLAAAGHQVTLAATSAERKDYGPLVRRLGACYEPAGFIGGDEAEIAELGRLFARITNPLRQTRLVLERMLEPGVPLLAATAQRLADANDLLIGHFILHPLAAVAEITGRPWLTVTLNHSAIPTAAVPPTGFPDLGHRINAWTWKLALVIINRLINRDINSFRRRVGLAPVRDFRDVWESRRGNLIAVSPSFCKSGADWGPHQLVCGFLNLPEAARPWAIPPDLAEFMADGPPPIYMTFGSMVTMQLDREALLETTGLLVEATRQAGQRAVIQSRWPEIAGLSIPPTVFRTTSLPHDRIFPWCVAVVHHGGAGTTQTATRHGRPSVVVPHLGDQIFWGRELFRLGVAPKPLIRQRLTARKLARAIRQVLAHPDMARRAAEIGTAMRAEHGVARAVELIEHRGIG